MVLRIITNIFKYFIKNKIIVSGLISILIVLISFVPIFDIKYSQQCYNLANNICYYSNSYYDLQICKWISTNQNTHNPPEPIPPEPSSSYNVMIDIKTMVGLREGWKIFSDGGFFSQLFFNLERDYEKILIAVVGKFDVGKTHIINFLEGKNFPSSYSDTTPAYAIVQSRIKEAYVYMDTMGINRISSSSLESNETVTDLQNIKAIDHLIGQTYFAANIIFQVVGPGTNTDICQNKHLINQYKLAKIQLVMIHNYKDYKLDKDVKKHIKDDIESIGGEKRIGEGGCSYWLLDGVYHFVIAQEGSEAGGIYNQCARNLIIKNIFTDPLEIKKVNILRKLIDIIEKNFGNYIKDPNISKDSFIKITKDETAGKNLFRKISEWFLNGSQKTDSQDIPIVNGHYWEVILENNRLRLYNNSFDLEFVYDDCCGFNENGWTPTIDVISNEHEFSVTIDASLSKVYWVCSNSTYSSKATVYIDRILPTYKKSDVKLGPDSRTYGYYKKEFDLPTARWSDCGKLASSAQYREGSSFVRIGEENYIFGSPFGNL